MIFMKIKKNPGMGPHMTFKNSKNSPIHRWFWYKEGFSPEIVDFALSREKADAVLDPFCGVGTTLLASMQAGKKSFGIDASPLAVFVSKVKTKSYSEDEIAEAEKFAGDFAKMKGRPSLRWSFELFNPRIAFPPRNFRDILLLREKIEERSGGARDLLLLALVSVLPRTSLIVKDGGVLKISKRKRAIPLKAAFRRKVKQIVSDLRNCRPEGPVPDVFLGDARRTGFAENTFDLVFTSPPYLNNVDYSKVYGLELTLLELDQKATTETRGRALRSFISKKPGKAESPPEAGEAGKRIPVVGMYFADMEKALEESRRVLSESGSAYYVVSNSVIHETHIPVDEILAKIGERIGFSPEIIVGAERIADVRPHKIKTRESIVVLRK